MTESDASIVVVDDAKFSSAIIAKVLRAGGFTNVRMTNNPLEALRSIEKRSASIVIADWLMPSMDGVDFARKVKDLDRDTDRFTYVMLMVARDDIDALQSAFESGVDDFMNKAQLREQLLTRVAAAQRIVSRENKLLKSNRTLQRRVNDLQNTDLVDPVTGLGNEKFTLERLGATLQQSENRGGAACLLLVGVNNLDELTNQFEESSIDELMSGISAKIRHLVRPLDVVTRPAENIFAVTTLQESLQNCTSKSFRRVFDSLYMHSFKTGEGYIPVVVGVTISAADAGTGHPNAEQFLEFSRQGLNRSFETGIITVRAYSTEDLVAWGASDQAR